MKLRDTLNILQNWDIRGRYVFRKCDLAIVLDESGRTLDQTLARLVKAGVLERPAHGVYLLRTAGTRVPPPSST